MDIRAIIFDLDGVIVHTDKYHYAAWKKIADGLGVYFDEKINDRLRGVSRMKSLDIILERHNSKLSDNEKANLAEQKNSIYREMLKSMKPSDIEESVLKTLKTLKGKGIRIAIGSSSKNAKYILKQVDLYDLFDAISDGNNISRSKPDPEVFAKAGEMLDAKPSFCMVIEDAEAGIEAANSAGMISVLIGDNAKTDKAYYHIHSLDELLDIV